MKKNGLIFQILFLVGLMTFTISCEVEQNEDLTTSALVTTKNQSIEASNLEDEDTRRNCGSFGGSNNLDLCGTNYYFQPIMSTSQWTIGDNGSNYIDYKIEQNFAYNCSFSYTCLRPCGPPVENVYGEVYFMESPAFNPDTFEQDLYTYLPYEGITPEKANELQEDLACKIQAYQLANYSGWIISEVNVFGDALLCNTSGISNHYLRATFKLTRHECP